MAYNSIKYFDLNFSGNQLYDSIRDTIKKLYPIDLARETSEYKEYPGIINLMAIFEENATSNKRFNQPWKEFLRKLRTGAKKRIHDNSYFTNPCFSGELILERYEDAALRRVKKIVFSVSQVANFFTVYGIDETFIKEKEMPWASGYHAINVITESPYSEFENSFSFLQIAIEEQYPGYKFVPIRASMCMVKGLQTPYSNSQECTVHHALFDSSFEDQHVHCLRGEIFYGSGGSNVSITLLPPPIMD